MIRALGHNCVAKYKCLEYFWKSGKTGRVYATDAHICLAARDHTLAPGYYDTDWHPVPKGDWVAQDVDTMWERCTRDPQACKLETLGDYYVADGAWVFDGDRVETLISWIGGKHNLKLTDMQCLMGWSDDKNKFGIICHEDKRVYHVGPSMFLTEKEAQDFAAMMGVNYV